MNLRLLLSLLLVYGQLAVSVFAETVARPRVALVVGNAKYEAAIGSLRNPVNDAKAVSRVLRDLGFSVIEECNLTRNQLLLAVGKFRSKLVGAEVAVFYYAGHGISVGGSNYLIPLKSGYAPEAADDLTLRMLAETKLVNAEQIVAEMNSKGSGCNLVILDACRNTPVARDFLSRNLASVGGLSEMKPPAGSLIAFATDAGHTAQDGEGPHGLYTGELIKHLRAPGLSIEQVFKRTRAGVLESSEGKQIPAEYSRLIGEDIFLAGPAAPAPQSPLVVEKIQEDATISTQRALRVEPPTIREISKWAVAGKSKECIEGLRLTLSSRGPGSYAVVPFESLLDFVKDELKTLSSASPQVENLMKICDEVLEMIPVCLPPEISQKNALIAKGQNRRGDCLFILNRSEDALVAYNIAISLAPDDAYPILNRGRAQLAMGRINEAKIDFTEASQEKFKQPKARQLALAALGALP